MDCNSVIIKSLIISFFNGVTQKRGKLQKISKQFKMCFLWKSSLINKSKRKHWANLAQSLILIQITNNRMKSYAIAIFVFQWSFNHFFLLKHIKMLKKSMLSRNRMLFFVHMGNEMQRALNHIILCSTVVITVLPISTNLVWAKHSLYRLQHRHQLLSRKNERQISYVQGWHTKWK